MKTEDEDGIAYWAEINKLANFLLIDNDITKNSNMNKVFTEVLPKLWPILYDSSWVKQINKSMLTIHFTDNLTRGIETGIETGIGTVESASKNDTPIIPYSMSVAASCMGMDIISKMVDILAKEGADISMEIVTDG